MKHAHGTADYKEQSKIYSKFLANLSDSNGDKNKDKDKDKDKEDKDKNKDHYRQCLLIIAYSKYKEQNGVFQQNFQDAYNNLDNIKKSTEQEENDLIGKNENLEQKIINIPSQL